jgi:hypothetical protein
MIHKQKPFRVRETYMGNPSLTKCVQALQAVVDSYGSSDSLLAAQCRDALKEVSSTSDLIPALEFLLADYVALNGENLTGSSIPADKAREALRKAKGEA